MLQITRCILRINYPKQWTWTIVCDDGIVELNNRSSVLFSVPVDGK